MQLHLLATIPTELLGAVPVAALETALNAIASAVLDATLEAVPIAVLDSFK